MEHQYEYKEKWRDILLGALVFGCAVLVNSSRISGEGLFVAIVMGILTVFRIGLVVFYAISAVTRMTVPQRIGLTRTDLIVPLSSWTSEEKVILFRDIIVVVPIKYLGRRSAEIIYWGAASR